MSPDSPTEMPACPLRSWSAWRKLGFVLSLGFDVWLVVCLHLVAMGRVTVGRTARLDASDLRETGEPVLYVYFTDGTPRHAWRRGLQWGDEALTVVYSPAIPRLHVTSLRVDMTRPMQLLTDPDFLALLGLVVAGTVASNLLFVYGNRLPTSLPRGWSLLPGLDDRHRPAPD